MLSELTIKDLAIIDDLTIEFGSGLNVFTGETGAGKSIIVDAISLILGDRASGDLIRSGAGEARVEALFNLTAQAYGQVDRVLDEAGVPTVESSGGDLVIKRIVQREGRNKVYINGSLTNLQTLSSITSGVIDIYGQNEHQSVTRPDEQLTLLDTFGSLKKELSEMERAYGEWKVVDDELRELLCRLKGDRGDVDYLAYQLEEIDGAGLKEGEDSALRERRERLKNSERIRSAAGGAEGVLYSSEGSVTEIIGTLLEELKGVEGFDKRLSAPIKDIEEAMYTLEGSAGELRGVASTVEGIGESDYGDYPTLEAVIERLDLLSRLKGKHGPELTDVIRKGDEIREHLSLIESGEEALSELESKAVEAMGEALKVAAKLTKVRRKAAAALKKRVEEELADLSMAGSLFEVRFSERRGPSTGGSRAGSHSGVEGASSMGPRGTDIVTFMLAPNKGEEIKELGKIASGGELSRIMLALKSIISAGAVSTLIFDEIDTGVGGITAHKVGEKLQGVASMNQVLCITHQPQIAALATTHLLVEKGEGGGKGGTQRTVTKVTALDMDGRIEDISRMLGGSKVTEATRTHARELLAGTS